MGKCSVCGNKIQYNEYKKIDGVVYCPDCVCFAPKKEAVDKKLAQALGEPIKMIIKKPKKKRARRKKSRK